MSVDVRPAAVDDDPPVPLEAEVTPGQERVTEEQAALQEGGADSPLAARLRAKKAALARRTKALAVPPDDVWSGELIAVFKPTTYRDGMTNAALIVEATDHLMVLDPVGGGGWSRSEETGDFEPDAHGPWRRLNGWAELGDEMDAPEGQTLGQIVTGVCGSREVLNGFAERVMAFIMGRQSVIEKALGE